MNEIIPKGTLLKIGEAENIDPSAIGVVYEISKDTKWGYYNHGNVIENPNNWRSDMINHRLRKDVDVIVKPAYSSNKEAKIRLDIL